MRLQVVNSNKPDEIEKHWPVTTPAVHIRSVLQGRSALKAVFNTNNLPLSLYIIQGYS